jgi:hypothetical protein
MKLASCTRKDGQRTDKTKLIAGFQNFEKALENALSQRSPPPPMHFGIGEGNSITNFIR